MKISKNRSLHLPEKLSMIRKFVKKRSGKTGLPPGSIVYTGEKVVENIKMFLIDYDDKNVEFRELSAIEEAFPFKHLPTVTWLNIYGLHETQNLEKIGEEYGIHPLVLEDILHTDQRPKVEFYKDYIFIVFKMLSYDEHKEEIQAEQISLILGENYVITFQEREGDVLDPVRERIKNPKSRFRKYGTDYLAYAIMDVIIDHYFAVLEIMGEKIEYLEGKVIESTGSSLVQEIQFMKRELIFLRKSIWPLREVLSELSREEDSLMSDEMRPYLRDVYDHTIQIVDTVETFRDMVSGILDIYLSSVSNRMNEIMKVLTIIATIFIPLTFIVGVYGMNFNFMPELSWKWGYPVVWLIITIIVLCMFAYFRKKKWL